MGVKDMGQRLCQSMQGGYQRFRTAMILDVVLFVCVGVLTYCHVYEIQDWYTKEIGCAAAAAAIGCIFAVALRLFLERRGQERHGFEVLLPVVVFVFFFILVQGHDWTDSYILLKTAGPALVFASVGLYCLEPQNEGENPPLAVFFAISKAWLVGTLLLISLGICLTAFDSLIFSLEFRLQAMLHFLMVEFSYLFIAVQIFLASLPDRGKTTETPALFRALLVRVLWPVYLILLAILYLYVAKIIYAWEMPVGMMNWFSSLALLAFSVFFFCFANDARYSLLQRFLRWGLFALFADSCGAGYRCLAASRAVRLDGAALYVDPLHDFRYLFARACFPAPFAASGVSRLGNRCRRVHADAAQYRRCAASHAGSASLARASGK